MIKTFRDSERRHNTYLLRDRVGFGMDQAPFIQPASRRHCQGVKRPAGNGDHRYTREAFDLIVGMRHKRIARTTRTDSKDGNGNGERTREQLTPTEQHSRIRDKLL